MITNDCQYYKNKNSFHYNITETSLGRGAYGQVKIAHNDLGQSVAIKYCPMDHYGIPNLFEAFIMKTIIHPNLNEAYDIVAEERFLYIIQPLAITDLHQYTSSHKSNHQCTLTELRHFSYSIIQAIAVLHHLHIIHCDIKASNVLLFNNNVVKLADFSLATWSINAQPYIHTVCTISHRPIECHLKQGWLYPLDIWCLGITLYEICYQELLIKNPLVPKNEYSPKTIKVINKQKCVNAILDWSRMTGEETSLSSYEIDYVGIQLTCRWDLPELQPMNNIIKKCLMLNPQSRATILDLIKDPWFDELTPVNPQYITIKLNTLTEPEQARISRYVQQTTQDVEVQNLAYDLMCKIQLPQYSEYETAIACTWVAQKILVGDALTSSLKLIALDRIKELELAIVHDLGFRL